MYILILHKLCSTKVLQYKGTEPKRPKGSSTTRIENIFYHDMFGDYYWRTYANGYLWSIRISKKNGYNPDLTFFCVSQVFVILASTCMITEGFNLFEFLERKFSQVRPKYQPNPKNRIQHYRRPGMKLIFKRNNITQIN